jgi:hypothetical protein
MENQQPDSASHEDMDDQPTKEISEPQTTTDEPALDKDSLGDKYMSGSENDRS